MMQEKAADLKEMRGTRIQFWDPTQADWFAGHILGMWSEKPKTHFLCAFDDETEYAIDPLKDTWQLVRACFHGTLMDVAIHLMPHGSIYSHVPFYRTSLHRSKLKYKALVHASYCPYNGNSMY